MLHIALEMFYMHTYKKESNVIADIFVFTTPSAYYCNMKKFMLQEYTISPIPLPVSMTG